MSKFLLSLIIFGLFFSAKLNAQAPNISYPSPQTFYLGETSTPVTVKNTGGAVLARLAPLSNDIFTVDNYYSFSDFVRMPAGDFYAVQYTMIYHIKANGAPIPFAGTYTRGYADGTGVAASFEDIGGIASDAAGNLYVTDNNYRDVTNSRIRKITPAGVVTTYVNGLSGPGAITVAPNGIIYYIAGSKIMKVATDGTVSLLAGKNVNGKDDGTGSNASFGYPLSSLATDKTGNVYVPDFSNNVIRKITPDGVVTTVAGSGSYGNQDGPAATASFVNPSAIRVDSKGNLIVRDGTPSIRKIAPDGTVTTIIRQTYYNASGQVVYYEFPSVFSLDKDDNLNSFAGNHFFKILLTGYNIAPNLPVGLVFNPDGSISGTPTVQSSPAPYKITATNSSGTSSANVSIEVAVPKKPPVITSFTPTSSPSYTYITILGNYFTGTKSVTFGGKPSDDLYIVTPTEISCRVPNGAASGSIVVTTPYGSAQISGYKYLSPPTITSFSPTSGGRGSVITIKGTNFTPTTGASIGGYSSQSVTFISSATIKAIVSPYANGYDGNISVYTNAGSATIPGFTFIGTPVISSVSPSMGVNGTVVTITGSNFNNATEVKFGNAKASSFKVLSPTAITAVVAAGSSSSITVTTPYGSISNYNSFNYNAPPVITQISPARGGFNSSIGIYGSNLSNPIVTIGGVAAQVSYSGPTYINVYLTNKALNGDVKVETVGGSTIFHGFLWVNAPVITSFTPHTAAAGTKITIKGNYLNQVSQVTLGGVYTQFTVLSPTTLVATVGGGSSGSLEVTSAGGTANLPGFNYTGPAVTSFLPVHAGVGQTVTITGSNFTNATGVDFGGVPAASFVVNSATQITAVVGAGRSGSVTVTTPQGKGSLAGFDHPGPAINYYATYYSGPILQSPINISGSNFTGATAVSFGGVPAASFVVISPNAITATPAISKSGNVVVTTPEGMDTQPGFVWVAPPSITDFTPTLQKNGGIVTITGTNFIGVTSVKFGGVAASYYAVSPTSITAYVGPGASGAVTVSTVGGTATKTGFIYTTPSIQSISPALASAGKSVTINGTNLDVVTSVKFGNADAASFTIVSSKKIIAVVGTGTSGNITVTGPSGTGYISGFTFLPPPFIYSITPGTGGAGTEVSIFGVNLTSTSSVKIGNQGATIISVADNLVKVNVGSGSTGKISLTTIAGTVLFDGFKWYRAPKITSATPLAANSETPVTINGTSFADVSAVKFGGVYAGFTIVSPTQIIAWPSYVKSGDITVTTPGGTATLPGFTFLPAPAITSFTVTGEGGNSTVTITGSNFNNVTSVQFGGVEAKTFTALSSTNITATPGSGGTGLITVKADGGTASIAGFLYNKPPSVLSFSPASGPIGTTLNITGDNFNLTPENNTVFFGPVKALVKSATKTQLTVTVPAGAVGPIVVVDADKKLSGSSNLPFLVTHKSGFSGFVNKTEIKLNSMPVYAVNDFDGDGKPDLLIAKDDSLYILKNGGEPALSRSSFSQKIVVETGKTVLAMVVGDVDGDGKKDILISIPHCIAVLRNTSVGNNLSFEMKVMEYMDNGSGMLLRDLNMDGRPDLIVGTIGIGSFPVYYPNTTTSSGGISFGPSIYLQSPSSSGILSFALTDIDGDNKPEPIFGTSYSDIAIFKNNSVAGALGPENFSATSFYHSGYYYTPWSMVTADLDGDGKADIIENDFSKDQMLVSRNIAKKGMIDASSLADAKPFSNGWMRDNVDAADINGDGKIDLIGTSNTAMYYARNISTKGNISLLTPASMINTFLGYTTFYDMDADGRIDVLAIDQSNKLYIYNNSPKPVPQITSVTPLTGGSGTKVIITGKYFDDATAVKFGATAAKSFTLLSPQSIEAIVGAGSTGSVSVQNPDGIGTFAGFTFIPAPAITSAVTSANKSSLLITGKNFTGATSVVIAAIPATSFTVNSATQITAVFPPVTGTLSVTTAGGVATLPNVTFTGAGAAVMSNEQDQSEQKLSVYTVVDKTTRTVGLTLSGGAPYHMLLNGVSYNTNDSLITLPLNKGSNKLTVTTSRLSQGMVEQTINLSALMTPYPNPFQNVLYINIGDEVVKEATVKIFNLSSGLLKLTQRANNQSGVISIDVSRLEMGVYTLHLILDSKESVYKIYK